MQVAGFVLVGGHSVRMGRDKAKLPVGAHFLLEDIAAKVSSVAQNVALIGASERYSDLGLKCFNDLRPSCGPLGGIETALATRRGELNLILACDMPGLSVTWLQQLVAQAVRRRSRCLVCRDAAGAVSPLCGIWSADCLPIVQRALGEKRLRLLDLLEELGAEYLQIGSAIANVNTPLEWSAWQNRLNFSQGHADEL